MRELFDRIAPRYDLMNDLMSFGLHRLWKRRAARVLVQAVRPVAGPIADLAGGTGDLSLLVTAKLPDRYIVNIDLSPGMLAIAARRKLPNILLVAGEGEGLPLGEEAVAAVALGFGLRNMADPQRALREIYRVLKKSGSLVLLEFSRPLLWFTLFYGFYSRYFIPLLGAAVARDRRAYRYLVESIERFPDAESMNQELHAAGFSDVSVKRLLFGVAALHVAVKT